MLTPSSSDCDSEENRRLRSVAIDSSTVVEGGARASQVQKKLDCDNDDSGTLKLYQIRARSLLQDYLDNTYGMEEIKNNGHVERNMASCKGAEDDAGFRLFKYSPPGVSFKFSGKEAFKSKGGRKRKDNACSESSKMFEARLQAAAIDGAMVKARAERAIEKSICSWLSNEAAEKEAQIIEEGRVAFLKRQRGEEWLPSVAKKMAMDMHSDAGLGTCREHVELKNLSTEYKLEENCGLLFQLQTMCQSDTSTGNHCPKEQES